MNEVFDMTIKALDNCVGSAKFPGIEYVFDYPVYRVCRIADFFLGPLESVVICAFSERLFAQRDQI